jgi:hypothetical protein
MILRRVIEHVRDQNWTAIGIDFLIVVIGVFVGIQVSNWNASLIERREAHDFMQRLEDDVQLSIKLTGSSIDFMTENARYADLALARLRACDLPASDRDDFATGLYRLGKVTPSRFVRTTFDELRESGKLRLVRSHALRRGLTEAARLNEWYEDVFELIAARIQPHTTYVDGQVIFEIDGTIGGAGRIGWDNVNVDFDTACKDRRFHTAVAAVRNYTYDILSDTTGMQRRFESMLAMIEKENVR